MRSQRTVQRTVDLDVVARKLALLGLAHLRECEEKLGDEEEGLGALWELALEVHEDVKVLLQPEQDERLTGEVFG